MTAPHAFRQCNQLQSQLYNIPSSSSFYASQFPPQCQPTHQQNFSLEQQHLAQSGAGIQYSGTCALQPFFGYGAHFQTAAAIRNSQYGSRYDGVDGRNFTHNMQPQSPIQFQPTNQPNFVTEQQHLPQYDAGIQYSGTCAWQAFSNCRRHFETAASTASSQHEQDSLFVRDNNYTAKQPQFISTEFQQQSQAFIAIDGSKPWPIPFSQLSQPQSHLYSTHSLISSSMSPFRVQFQPTNQQSLGIVQQHLPQSDAGTRYVGEHDHNFIHPPPPQSTSSTEFQQRSHNATVPAVQPPAQLKTKETKLKRRLEMKESCDIIKTEDDSEAGPRNRSCRSGTISCNSAKATRYKKANMTAEEREVKRTRAKEQSRRRTEKQSISADPEVQRKLEALAGENFQNLEEHLAQGIEHNRQQRALATETAIHEKSIELKEGQVEQDKRSGTSKRSLIQDPEKLEQRRAKRKENTRQVRILEKQGKLPEHKLKSLQLQREQDRERKRAQRAAMTSEQRRIKLQKDNLYNAQRKAKLNEEEKQARKNIARMKKQAKLAMETPEEKQARKAKAREYCKIFRKKIAMDPERKKVFLEKRRQTYTKRMERRKQDPERWEEYRKRKTERERKRLKNLRMTETKVIAEKEKKPGQQ